jgi:prepilin-type N-terminal cleavage/methylation domain-containing protein
MKKGVTLIEMIIVIIIVGILATIAVPQYIGVKERSMDKEARANLSTIQAAEKNYRIEKGSYYAGSTADLNTNLKLLLPTTSPQWDYAVADNGDMTATRQFGSSTGRTWTLLSTGDTPPTCSDGSGDVCR